MVEEAIAFWPHTMQKHYKRGFWYGFNIAAILLIILFVLGIPLLQAFASFLQTVDIRIEGKEQTYQYVPTTLSIDITNQSLTPLNAIEFELVYNPSELLILSITPSGTLCEEQFIITNSINTASGTALFQCGTRTPFSGEYGSIASIVAFPLRSGTTTIAFGPTTNVLAHDGYGTNTTRTRTDLILTAL